MAMIIDARADVPAADQAGALAQTLFDEAVKLMDAGRFSEACPKLAESQRLDPAGGTLIDLGLCRQSEGKLASAWTAYNDALSQAIKDKRKERENTARLHVEELEGKVARLAIDLSEEARSTSLLEISLDGTPVRQAAWSVLTPIDRGTHAIVVTAPGKVDFRTSVVVKEDGVVERVTIPALVDAPLAPVLLPPAQHHLPVQTVVGWMTVAVGAVALGVGVASGVAAINDRQQSNVLCNFPNGLCTQQGFNLNEQAKSLAWAADFGIGLGLVAIGAGVVLVLTAPRSTPRTHVVPMASAHLAGAALITSF
jgi:hypothetical protein